ncbi:MAG: PEGA domain-containing protein [Methanoregula sp.]|nr:PEGA domain-containing protein [Methanoregula sp.]
MKRILFVMSIFCCLVLALVPAASAIGGDEGWITINCNVNGATVSFDGDYKGIINGGSLTVPVFTTGAPYQSFSVEKSGYTPYSGGLSMPAAGETGTYYATLNPIPTPTPVPPVNYGSIYVESSPSGVQVYFNGNYRGLAPLTISGVWPGTYTVHAELNGYNPYSTTTTVYPGQQSNVFCPLSQQDTSGTLYILSSPSNADVTLDGIYKGKTPLTLNNLAASTHILQLDHTGYYDWKSNVDVPAGGTRTISGTLNPIPASNTGWIYVSSSPGGAAVTLDGNTMGQTPYSGSLKLESVQAGDHTVALSLSGYQPYTTTTRVLSNTVSEVSAILQPSTPISARGGLSVSSVPAGSNVFLDNNFIGISPLTLNDVSAGSHIVTFKLEGYTDYSSTTQVNVGAISTVSAALSPAEQPTQKSGAVPFMVCGALAIIGLLTIRKNH